MRVAGISVPASNAVRGITQAGLTTMSAVVAVRIDAQNRIAERLRQSEG